MIMSSKPQDTNKDLVQLATAMGSLVWHRSVFDKPKDWIGRRETQYSADAILREYQKDFFILYQEILSPKNQSFVLPIVYPSLTQIEHGKIRVSGQDSPPHTFVHPRLQNNVTLDLPEGLVCVTTLMKKCDVPKEEQKRWLALSSIALERKNQLVHNFAQHSIDGTAHC